MVGKLFGLSGTTVTGDLSAQKTPQNDFHGRGGAGHG
nr:MAG TPA: Polyribonucleotide nucleotidyltransferase [Caudoviricetes sp.]